MSCLPCEGFHKIYLLINQNLTQRNMIDRWDNFAHKWGKRNENRRENYMSKKKYGYNDIMIDFLSENII